MLTSKFKGKMKNYYLVFIGRKDRICDSWIEGQRRVKKTKIQVKKIKETQFLFFVFCIKYMSCLCLL